MKSRLKLDVFIPLALAAGGLLARLPYLNLVPVFEDEVLQTVYALSIRPGEFMPLVGNDPYAGPLFSYLMAGWLGALGTSFIMPRLLAACAGALTVALTYLLARALDLEWPWAALAGLLMLANPQHILINSHYAGTTYILPLFSTAFLAALALATRRGSGPWLVISAVCLGLTMQTNPVPAIMLPGIALWAFLKRRPAWGLRTRWPYLAVCVFLLAYSPVIAYNVQSRFVGVQEARVREYVWQPNPSPAAFIQNEGRLIMQLARQAGGVVEGDETVRSLAGLPALLALAALAGLVQGAWRDGQGQGDLSLPLLAVISQALIMPWLSNHYGLTGATRFTNMLTPLLFVAMAAWVGRAWQWAGAARLPAWANRGWVLAGAVLLAVALAPYLSLLRYYDHAVARGETNAPHLAFASSFHQRWQGEPVFLAESMSSFKAVEYLLALERVPYMRMPAGRIMERMTIGEESGPVALVLPDEDAQLAAGQADLIRWNPAAAGGSPGYAAYTIPDAHQVRKPAFVIERAAMSPTMRPVQVDWAGRLSGLGYEIKPVRVTPGAEFVVNVYWTAQIPLTATYTGFVHLVGADGKLVAQDDHELGRGYYRTLFWQPGEVIREKYLLRAPAGQAEQEYGLQVGVYEFPSLEQLGVRFAPVITKDGLVMLATVQVGQ